MSIPINKKSVHSKKTSPLWVSTTILDAFLHRTALLAILKTLAELGHKPSLVAIRSFHKLQPEDSQVRITSIPLRFFPVISPIMFTIMLVLLLPVFVLYSGADFIIFDPDVHILSCFSSLVVCKLRKVKLVLDIRTVPVETVGIRGFLRKFMFAVSILVAKNLFDGITIITPSMKEKICDDFKLNSAKVGVWTSGVSDRLFDSRRCLSESAELKTKFGLANKFIVFYHGVFTETRGLTETIKAMQILKRKKLNVFLLLLGTGPLAPTLRNMIRNQGLQDTVMIHKPVDQKQVPKFINMCDIGIVPLPDHPYWRFQSPLKLLEYLSMEKVVVLTDVPAHRLIIGEEKCGIYISSIKPIEIANAIEYAYRVRWKLREWGRFGRIIIQKKYTWDIVAKDLTDYLLSLTR